MQWSELQTLKKQTSKQINNNIIKTHTVGGGVREKKSTSTQMIQQTTDMTKVCSTDEKRNNVDVDTLTHSHKC